MASCIQLGTHRTWHLGAAYAHALYLQISHEHDTYRIPSTIDLSGAELGLWDEEMERRQGKQHMCMYICM